MMKSAIIFALLATVALTAVVPDANSKFHVHLHIDQPVKTTKMGGIVRNLIQSTINKPNVELHLHVDEFVLDDEALEDFNIKDIIKDIGKEVTKGFNILKQGIQVAMDKAKTAFDKVKSDISKIQLPKINLPAVIATTIKIAEIASKLIPCATTLKNVLPNLIGFAKAAAANSAGEAVQQLLAMLRYMPEITDKCLNKPFNIPPNVMSKIQCGADIVALAAIVAQFIMAPANIIGNINGLKSMIELIPTTISDCTGAFK